MRRFRVDTFKLFTLLFVLSLVFIIAMLLVMLSAWSITIQVAVVSLAVAVSLLYVLFEIKKDRLVTIVAPEAPAPKPALDSDSELLAAVNVLVAGRLKEIDQVIGRGEGLEEMGETESRLRQAREFSLSSAIAAAPDLILSEEQILKTALNRAWRILHLKTGCAVRWTDEGAGDGRVIMVEGLPEESTPPTEIKLSSLCADTLRGAALLKLSGSDCVAGVLSKPVTQFGVPIQVEGFRWGWMLLEADAERTATAIETRFLTALGRETAIAMATVADWKAARENLQSLLARFGDHLNARRNMKEGRGRRVAALFEAAGRQASFSPGEIELGKLAACVIDLGEVGVPELVLNKTGELSPQEMKFLRDHPALSVKLLRRLLLLEPLEHVLIAHHEAWNGSGYPSGMKGEEIPRVARLLSICDALEAMVSSRPYRDAYDAADALNEIKKEIGGQFDPALVEAVERAFEKWLAWMQSK